MKRREARETAFMLIYEVSYHIGEDYRRLYDTAMELMGLETDEYIEKVYFGVIEKLDELDGKIGGAAVGWKTERLSRISLAIMRLCVYEMMYVEDVPFSSAIDEAVELAKKYDHDGAPAFINGVVNAIADREGLKDKR